MKFRSTKRSGAALASTALVASALSVPMLFAAPAQAAPTTTVEDASFSCVYGDFTLDWVTDIDFDATWATAGGRAQITATLKDDMMAGGLARPRRRRSRSRAPPRLAPRPAR